MSFSISTDLCRPVTIRQLWVAAEPVLAEMLGLDADRTRIIVGGPVYNQRGFPAHVPLEQDLLDRELRPEAMTRDALADMLFFVADSPEPAEVSVWGVPTPGVIATPYKTPISEVLAIATVIGASRVVGNGIGDAHLLFADRDWTAVPSPTNELEVLAYLREPLGQHADLSEAAKAVIAKTRLARPTG
jgi:hypothetical protein